MKFKTTGKVSGEIVLGGLNLVLKKDSIFDVDRDKVGHHELVWAIHNGYIQAVDVDAQVAAGAKKRVYTNISKKALMSANLKSPFSPGQSIVLLNDDPTCNDLNKLVEMKLVILQEDVVAPALAEIVKESVKVVAEKKTDSRKSFKKSSKPSKIIEEEKVELSNKVTSGLKPIISKSSPDIIFVGQNNEELKI